MEVNRQLKFSLKIDNTRCF